MNSPRLDIYDYIGDGAITASDFIASLRALGDVSAIDLHISSGGGDVDQGHAIYNELVRHPARITVYIDGMAASMASAIAMAGDHIVMAENAAWMMHNPASLAYGGVREMESASKRLAIMTDAIVKAYQRHSTADEAQIRAWMDAETWMSADEAVAAGFAHEIGPAAAMAASVDLSRFDRIPGRIAAILATIPATTQTAKPEESQMADEPVITEDQDTTDYKAEFARVSGELEALKIANAEQVATARAAAVTAERQRIADVQALSYPGVESVISECIAGGVNRADAALKLNEFEKARTSQALAALKASAPPAVASSGDDGATATVDPLKLDEAGQRAHFAATASLHGDHLDADAYVKYLALQKKRGAK